LTLEFRLIIRTDNHNDYLLHNQDDYEYDWLKSPSLGPWGQRSLSYVLSLWLCLSPMTYHYQQVSIITTVYTRVIQFNTKDKKDASLSSSIN